MTKFGLVDEVKITAVVETSQLYVLVEESRANRALL